MGPFGDNLVEGQAGTTGDYVRKRLCEKDSGRNDNCDGGEGQGDQSFVGVSLRLRTDVAKRGPAMRGAYFPVTMRILAVIGFGTGCLLLAADQPKQGAPNLGEPKPSVQVSKTDRFDFPSGGTLRFNNSVGVLTVEAWDRPDVEITTIKSTKADIDSARIGKARRDLDKVSVATERHGDELVVTTTFPRHRPYRIFYPLSGNAGFNLEYHVKAPANARIIADHILGDVNIDGLVGDIQVNVAQGKILLHLPEEEKYDIHAKSSVGSVNSDFSELEKRTRWLLGHRSIEENPAAMHRLNLKVGFGDIVILRIHTPKPPEPATCVPKPAGL